LTSFARGRTRPRPPGRLSRPVLALNWATRSRTPGTAPLVTRACLLDARNRAFGL